MKHWLLVDRNIMRAEFYFRVYPENYKENIIFYVIIIKKFDDGLRGIFLPFLLIGKNLDEITTN